MTSLISSFMASTWSIVGMFVAEVFDRRLAGKVSNRLLWPLGWQWNHGKHAKVVKVL